MNVRQMITLSQMCLLVWCGVAVAPTCAQTITHVPLFTFHGDSAGDTFGFSVSGAGDVNGDGFGDLIVGAPGDDNNGFSYGSARVFSGVDGSVLYNFVGDSVGDDFGYSVSGAGSGTSLFLFSTEMGPGDINGDGIDDLLVGAPRDDNNGEDTGSVRVFSGSDGSVLYTIDGDPTVIPGYRAFGTTVNGGRDASGDGLIDTLVVGASDDGSRVHLVTLSGAISPPAIFENQEGGIFGRNFDSVGDVNGDGVADSIARNRLPFPPVPGAIGSVRVTSGSDSSVIYTFEGDAAGDFFGASVSGAGDVNGDGVPDFIVGSPNGGDNGGGYARVFASQITPTLLLGDVNLDGEVDFSDIPVFIAILQMGQFEVAADCNQDGEVNFADIPAFIDILMAQ